MFPCITFSGGSSQDAAILVGELAVTVKLLGACEGTEIFKYKKMIAYQILVLTWPHVFFNHI